MAGASSRDEIGFSGGQVMSARLGEDALTGLRSAVESNSGWHDLETDEGSVALDASKVVFVRVAGSQQTIGFRGA